MIAVVARRLALVATLGAVASWSAPALAADPAAAQALFDQARKLMLEEKWAEACPKLQESQRLDPAGGTLLHLALCREREGRVATAWTIYVDALSQAKRDGRKDRAKIAQERIDALAPKLPRLRIRVAAQNKATHGFTLSRDDGEVGAAQWDNPFPIDPGSVTLSARAPGKKPLSTVVEIPARGGEVTVDIQPLEDEGAAAGSVPRKVEPAHDEAPASDGSTQRTLAYVAGGAGIVGIAVGSIFGVVSMGKKSDAKSECRAPDYKLCTAAGVEAGKDAISAGNVSTVAFIVGGALLAGGAVLYFTAPSSRGSVALVPSVGTREASVGLHGSF
jgi:hypothetical protein